MMTSRSRSVSALSIPLVFSALAVSVPAAAQTQSVPAGSSVRQMPSQVKHVGTFHVATQTWTRATKNFGSFGPDVIFNNNAMSGYFSTFGSAGSLAPGSTNFDEGGLPGTTNGDMFPFMPNRDSYRVTNFEIGYCDLGGFNAAAWEISFYDQYTSCELPSVAPVATVSLSGLPAGGGCWIFDVDLTGGMEFDLGADGGDGWDGDPALDSFGWSHRYTGTSANAGMLLCGDPISTDLGYVPGSGAIPRTGAGTYYGPLSQCFGQNTGYLIQDEWLLESSTDPAASGCYEFGGYRNLVPCNGISNPWASYYLTVQAEGAPTVEPLGAVFCTSNPNSTSLTTSLALEGLDTAVDDLVSMTAGNLPVGTFGYFITSLEAGLALNPGGSAGNLCLAGGIGRLAMPGQIKAAGDDGTINLDTALGEWSLTELPSALPPLSYAAVAGMTSHFQLWHRDAGMTGPSSNFSDGVSVTWN